MQTYLISLYGLQKQFLFEPLDVDVGTSIAHAADVTPHAIGVVPRRYRQDGHRVLGLVESGITLIFI